MTKGAVYVDLTNEDEALSVKNQQEEAINQQVAQFMDSLDFEGMDPIDFFINAGPKAAEASYDYVNTVIQNAVVAMKKADLKRIEELENTNTAYAEKIAALSDDNERLAQELYNKRLELAEISSRLANAATQLDEERDEVARLNSQVDDLRKEIAVGAVAATQVIDTRSAREKFLEERQKEEDAKPIIHNIRWEDEYKKTMYLAELAETEETIKFSYLSMSGDVTDPTSMRGKYRVVTSEDANSFRTAYLAAQESQSVEDDQRDSEVETESLEVIVPSAEEELSENPFREEDEEETAGSELVTEPSSVVGQFITEERILSIENDLAKIKGMLRI